MVVGVCGVGSLAVSASLRQGGGVGGEVREGRGGGSIEGENEVMM